MRNFVKLLSPLSKHLDLMQRCATLEKKFEENFRVVFEASAQLKAELKTGAYANRRIDFTEDLKVK